MSLDMKEQLQALKEKLNNEMTQGNEVKHIDGRVEHKESNNVHSNGSNVAINKTNYTKDCNERTYGGQQMEIRRGDNLLIQLEERGVGSEQSGTRNAICIQNDVANKYSPTTIVAFVTSRLTKAKLPVHIEINGGLFGFPKDSVVLVEQIRTIDKKRIIKKVGFIDDDIVMQKIDNAIDISVKKLKPKSLLEKLSSEIRKHIITTLKDVHEYEITIEKMKYKKIKKEVIEVMIKEKLALLNEFMNYCRERQLPYEEFYKLNVGVSKEVLEMSIAM